ncbi:hypothetical protein ABPG72_002506 [Tetrahymena utriculariae]
MYQNFGNIRYQFGGNSNSQSNGNQSNSPQQNQQQQPQQNTLIQNTQILPNWQQYQQPYQPAYQQQTNQQQQPNPQQQHYQSPPQCQQQLPIKQFQNFSIIMSKQLGKGQYGEVYLCLDNTTQRQYACKMIAISNQQDVLKELQVAQEIRGEFICELKYAGVSSNYLYLISEYCPDGTLKQYLQNNKQPSIDEIMRIFLQIVKGYSQSIYSKGCVHRDIKLDNILMKDGRPKICDFGFGKFLDDVSAQIAQSYKCTPLYGAPQITHTHNIKYSYKADIYSMGILLYQMTNQLINPNQMKNANDLNQFHNQNREFGIQKTLKFQNQVDPNIKDIIYKMLEYREEDRISIEDLEKRVEQICKYLRNPTSQQFTDFIKTNNDQFGSKEFNGWTYN